MCEDLLFRLTAKNLTDTAVKMKISFTPKCPEADINLAWPRGGIKEFLGAGVTGHLMTLQKRAPSAASEQPEIAKLDLGVKWSRYSASDFTMSCYASGSDRPAAASGTSGSASKTGTHKANQDVQSQRRNGVRLDLKPTSHPDS